MLFSKTCMSLHRYTRIQGQACSAAFTRRRIQSADVWTLEFDQQYIGMDQQHLPEPRSPTNPLLPDQKRRIQATTLGTRGRVVPVHSQLMSIVSPCCSKRSRAKNFLEPYWFPMCQADRPNRYLSTISRAITKITSVIRYLYEQGKQTYFSSHGSKNNLSIQQVTEITLAKKHNNSP